MASAAIAIVLFLVILIIVVIILLVVFSPGVGPLIIPSLICANNQCLQSHESTTTQGCQLRAEISLIDLTSTHPNNVWQYNPISRLITVASTSPNDINDILCLTSDEEGSKPFLSSCNIDSKLQQWTIIGTTLQSDDNDLCVSTDGKHLLMDQCANATSFTIIPVVK